MALIRPDVAYGVAGFALGGILGYSVRHASADVAFFGPDHERVMYIASLYIAMGAADVNTVDFGRLREIMVLNHMWIVDDVAKRIHNVHEFVRDDNFGLLISLTTRESGIAPGPPRDVVPPLPF